MSTTLMLIEKTIKSVKIAPNNMLQRGWHHDYLYENYYRINVNHRI